MIRYSRLGLDYKNTKIEMKETEKKGIDPINIFLIILLIIVMLVVVIK